MVTRQNILCLVAGFLLAGCISAKLGYKHYGMDAVSYEGWLRAPKAADDIPLAVCKPDDFQKGKCVVLLVDEFEAFGTELLQCRAALKDCQKNCPKLK